MRQISLKLASLERTKIFWRGFKPLQYSLRRLSKHQHFCDFNLFHMISFLFAKKQAHMWHTHVYTHIPVLIISNFDSDYFYSHPTFHPFPSSSFILLFFFPFPYITNIYWVLLCTRHYGRHWGYMKTCYQGVQNFLGEIDRWTSNYSLMWKKIIVTWKK